MKQLLQTLFFFLLVAKISFAQWVQTNGPYGGVVNCFASIGTNRFAGTGQHYANDGGVFRSTDGGSSWTAAGLPQRLISAFAVSGSNLFAGYAPRSSNDGGIFLSTDNGTNWIAANNGLPSTVSISDLAVSGTNIFAGTEGYGIFLSTNNGGNWVAVNSGLPDNPQVTALAVSGTYLFAFANGSAGPQGIFLSTNNGTSWIPAGLDSMFVEAFVVSGTNLFAGTYNGGVFRSSNNGMSWIRVGLDSLGVPALAVSGINLFAATGDHHGGHAPYRGHGVYLSTDNGTTWNAVNNGLTNLAVVALAANGSDILAGTLESGVFRSTNNGTNWLHVEADIARPSVRALAQSGTHIVAGVRSRATDIFFTTDYGTHWEQTGTQTTLGGIEHFAVMGTDIFALSGYDGVFISSDNGITWANTSLGLTARELSLAVNETDVFVGSDNAVWRSTNRGASWHPFSAGLPSLCSVYSLFSTTGNLVAGVHGDSGGIFLSTNRGANWTASYLCNTCRIFSFARTESGDLFASGENLSGNPNPLYRSTTSGATWAPVGPIGLMSVLTASGANLFAGNDSGVYLSTNNGASWTAVNSGLTNLAVNALLVSGQNLFVGTYEGGVWRRPLSEMVPVELTSFTASANGAEVILNWSTATELNNYGFEIQRKALGGEFATVAFVKGQGTTTQQNQYSFIDKNLDEGKYFYRLKQIDFGGKYEYSQIVEVNWSPFTTYKLEQNYPNPFNPTTTIGFGITEKSNVKLSVLNILGEEIKILLNEEKEAGYHSIEFSAQGGFASGGNASDIPSGVYFYRIKAGNFIDTKKMILLR